MSTTNPPAIDRLLRRAAKEIWDGCYVNLGIGLPSKVVDYLDDEINPFIHSENGLLGVKKEKQRSRLDPMLIDAAGQYVAVREGGCFFDSGVSFGIIRSKRLDLCMLGAFEVDAQGNLANWKINGQFTPGIGGAMELAQKCRHLIVLMTCLDKKGRSKVRQNCELPLTACSCVDSIITDKAVFKVTTEGLLVTELAEGVTESDLGACVEARLTFADKIQTY